MKKKKDKNQKNQKNQRSQRKKKAKTGSANPAPPSVKVTAKQNPNPDGTDEKINLNEYIIELRHKLNWQIFKKCMEKKFLSEEMDILE